MLHRYNLTEESCIVQRDNRVPCNKKSEPSLMVEEKVEAIDIDVM